VPRPALHGVLGAGGRPLLGLHRSPEHPDTELKANPGGFAIKFLMSEELATRVAADPVRLTWYAQDRRGPPVGRAMGQDNPTSPHVWTHEGAVQRPLSEGLATNGLVKRLF
jgi:hypothetical protein